MNVLSVFDGMSCGRIALERAGIPVNNYYASEIDKYAVIVSENNYPDIQRLGDIIKINGSAFDGVYLPKIDLFIGGSPCQGFSFAGKQLNFDDPRSVLFWEYVRILKELKQHNPDIKFMLENVRMKKESLSVITDALGVEPIRINSSLVSGQLRDRFYWCNFDVSQPDDKEMLFQECLISDFAKINKAYALTATYYKKGGEPTRQRNFKKSQRPIAWINDTNTRWLTPVECERLQTIPDNYTESVSNTQRYKMLGNGWTVDVIAHIFEGLKP